MAEKRVLLAHVHEPDQYKIEGYESRGGYQAIRKAIPGLTPDTLIEMVKQSGLRGRGGAGFGTGMKWGFVPQNIDQPKNLVCNCDESEPGTFKDRLLIEKDPHQLNEGMILASYDIRSRKAFLYCRGKYFKGIRLLWQAVEEAKQKGYLGQPLFN